MVLVTAAPFRQCVFVNLLYTVVLQGLFIFLFKKQYSNPPLHCC